MFCFKLNLSAYCHTNLIAEVTPSCMAFFSVWKNWTGFGHQHGRFLILFWATNMPDVTSSDLKPASHYTCIFLLFLMFSEVLYEDEAFKQRQLSALLASKVCDKIYKYVLWKVFQCSCRAANIFSSWKDIFPSKTPSW